MVIIAIDPGASGGLAVWDKGIKSLYKCPQDVRKMAEIVNSAKSNNYIENIDAVLTPLMLGELNKTLHLYGLCVILISLSAWSFFYRA